MSITTIRAHAISTNWQPISELGNWPLDHVFVSTINGKSWGCFGRNLDKEPKAPIIAKGKGHIEWIKEIAGNVTKSSVAGVNYKINGICHNAANRLLLVTGVDVSKAPGNEIAIPIYGKFGMGLKSFAKSVEDAAYKVNLQTPKLISDEMVCQAVSLITHSKEDEIEILIEDLKDFFNISANKLSIDSQKQLYEIYTNLYLKRQSIYNDLINKKITLNDYNNNLRKNILETLENAKSVLGNSLYTNLFKLPPKVAIHYVA